MGKKSYKFDKHIRDFAINSRYSTRMTSFMLKKDFNVKVSSSVISDWRREYNIEQRISKYETRKLTKEQKESKKFLMAQISLKESETKQLKQKLLNLKYECKDLRYALMELRLRKKTNLS